MENERERRVSAAAALDGSDGRSVPTAGGRCAAIIGGGSVELSAGVDARGAECFIGRYPSALPLKLQERIKIWPFIIQSSGAGEAIHLKNSYLDRGLNHVLFVILLSFESFNDRSSIN